MNPPFPGGFRFGRGCILSLDEQDVLRRFHRVLEREFGSGPDWDLSSPPNVVELCRRLVTRRLNGVTGEVGPATDQERVIISVLTGLETYLKLTSENGGGAGSRGILSGAPESEPSKEFLAAYLEANPEARELHEIPEDEPGVHLYDDCPSCKKPVPRGAMIRFCPYCGTSVRWTPCSSCGEKLRLDWRYCVGCGAQVEPEGGPY